MRAALRRKIHQTAVTSSVSSRRLFMNIKRLSVLVALVLAMCTMTASPASARSFNWGSFAVGAGLGLLGGGVGASLYGNPYGGYGYGYGYSPYSSSYYSPYYDNNYGYSYSPYYGGLNTYTQFYPY